MLIPRRYVDTAPGEFPALLVPWSRADWPLGTAASIARWEQEFASFIGRQAAIATGSGRFAMRLILAGLKLPAGSEIIIPAYTLKDLLPLIAGLGLVPVPADIAPDHWNISAATIRPRLTPRTSAILALHLFGNPCPLDEIMALARPLGLKVIEDCAHSAGSSLHERATGAFGDAAFFSFEAIKPLNTYGGGMVVTDDLDLANEIRAAGAGLAPALGLTGKVRAALFERLMFQSGLARIPLALLASAGGKQLVTRLYRLIQPPPSRPRSYSPLQAELGCRRLATLAGRVAERQRQAALLGSLLPATCQAQQVIPGGKANYYFFVVKVAGEVERLRKRLLRLGIDAGIGAEIADDCATLLGDRGCPEAAELYRRALHLPLHEKTSDHQLKKIAEILHGC
ncbi:MAG: hypothetical protein HGA96_04570 [Desulfobulbaceae bacterium]|nr:hypothetical protein [Desulfobulbaceae bacterium]